MNENTVAQLLEGIARKDRRSLAKAITLIESSRSDQRHLAGDLLMQLTPLSGRALRIGISGVPGVGKSTFIEAFGKSILARRNNLAVLAIDPSSPLTGGSIMGDRTRMEELSSDPRVFIRPSPTSGTLGGVARHTRETIIACEAAGYDLIFVETVGVGQSETVVASMVDVFLMLYLPNSGDELQGIKKGILELADIIAITKADGPLKNDAARAKNELSRALMLTRSRDEWTPPVHLISALEGEGLSEIDASIDSFVTHQKTCGAFAARRRVQSLSWFHSELGELLRERLESDVDLKTTMSSLEQDVLSQKLPGSVAATRLIDEFLSRRQRP